MAEKIIGIDLGTSNSAASVMQGGKPTLIPAAEGTTVAGKAFPSVVAFSKDGELLVGEPARRQAVTNPDNTIREAKRKMGEDFLYKIQGKEYKPQQISAFILQKIKRDAEAFTGDTINKAVITVPAYFNDNQRQATKDAGTIAGLEVVRIINEPTAASLAFGIDKSKEDMKILVFDFGGGTLDVTIMEMGGGVFEVMSTSGDTKLGGADMDQALIDYVIDEFRKKEGIDLSSDSTAVTRIKEGAEKAKIELSTVMETEVNLPFIAQDPSGAKNLEVKITRAKLEDLVNPIVQRCKSSIDKALEDAKLSASDITKIVLIGGPTRMPIVKKFVSDTVGKEAESGVDPMEAVAFGAAVQAGIIAGDVTSDIVLLDVTPLTLGIETLGGVREPIIERNTTIPTSKDKTFTTAADSQTAVTINVVQGERPMVADNVSLGSFNLTDIPPAPRGVPQINVKKTSFEILFGLSLRIIILFFTRNSSILFGTEFIEIVGIPNNPASAVIVPPDPTKQSTLSNKSFPLTGFEKIKTSFPKTLFTSLLCSLYLDKTIFFSSGNFSIIFSIIFMVLLSLLMYAASDSSGRIKIVFLTFDFLFLVFL